MVVNSKLYYLVPITIKPTGTSSLEQFPGYSYFNIRKLSEGLRRLTGGWERYARRRSRRRPEEETEMTHKGRRWARPAERPTRCCEVAVARGGWDGTF